MRTPLTASFENGRILRRVGGTGIGRISAFKRGTVVDFYFDHVSRPANGWQGRCSRY
jgi:hypothetical protein